MTRLGGCAWKAGGQFGIGYGGLQINGRWWKIAPETCEATIQFLHDHVILVVAVFVIWTLALWIWANDEKYRADQEKIEERRELARTVIAEQEARKKERQKDKLKQADRKISK